MEKYKKIFKEVLNNSLHNSIRNKQEEIKEEEKILKTIGVEIESLNKQLDHNFHNYNNVMGEIYKIVIQIEKELDENQVKDLKKLFSNLLKSYNFKSVDLVKKGNNTFTNFYYDLDLEKTNKLRNIFEDIER
jgi:hypothetical protein